MLLDDDEVAAVVQPTGSTITRRVGERGGPQGRSLLPGTWDGSREESTWDRPPSVRLHPVDRSYSVIRSWVSEEERFTGWYVNLEQPWSRTLVGFDSRDDVLDITASSDLSEWQLKDVDELEFAVEVGLVTRADARAVRSAADSAVDDLVHRRWPFDEATWERLWPQEPLQPVGLVDGWDLV